MQMSIVQRADRWCRRGDNGQIICALHNVTSICQADGSFQPGRPSTFIFNSCCYWNRIGWTSYHYALGSHLQSEFSPNLQWGVCCTGISEYTYTHLCSYRWSSRLLHKSSAWFIIKTCSCSRRRSGSCFWFPGLLKVSRKAWVSLSRSQTWNRPQRSYPQVSKDILNEEWYSDKIVVSLIPPSKSWRVFCLSGSV